MNRAMAYAIGNGTSRRRVDLKILQKTGDVYGCNAIYREFVPDVLVATDQGISKEIESTGYPTQNLFYTRKPNEKLGAFKIPPEWSGWSSGPVSIGLALAHGHSVVYLIGHDFGSIDNIFNNCYAGTPNYRDIGTAATYAGNWLSQIEKLLLTYTESKIVRVVGSESSRESKALYEKENYQEIDIETFSKSINT